MHLSMECPGFPQWSHVGRALPLPFRPLDLASRWPVEPLGLDSDEACWRGAGGCDDCIAATWGSVLDGPGLESSWAVETAATLALPLAVDPVRSLASWRLETLSAP